MKVSEDFLIEYKNFLCSALHLPADIAKKLVSEYGKHEVLDRGDSNCNHQKVLYIDNSFDGQAWWCDDCSRHERLRYTPGEIIKFPPYARIRTPNSKSGGEKVYAYRADINGIVKGILPIKKRSITKDAEKQLKLLLKKHK